MFPYLQNLYQWTFADPFPGIVVDHREQKSGIVEELLKQPNFDVLVDHLHSGDIAVGALGIERKTVEDFLRSLGDGRLFRQLIVLKRSYRLRLLLLEGEANLTRSRSVKGAVAKITAGLQVPLIQTENLAESAHYIHIIAMHSLALHERTLRPYRQLTNKDIAFQQVFFLSGLPGVGIVRARALLQHFGSLEQVLKATESELHEVPGIGNHLAAQLRALLSARFSAETESNDQESTQRDTPEIA